MKAQTFLTALGLAMLTFCNIQAEETLSAEDEIMASVVSYIAAFNAGDCDRLADHWAENAEYLCRTTGAKAVGREQIRAQFAEQCQQADLPKLSVEVDSIRFVKPDVAIEEGVAKIAHEGEEPELFSYTAVHVKEENQWKLDSVHETHVANQLSNPSPVSDARQQLEPLAWLIGHWVDKSEGSIVETNTRWAKNETFLIRSFKVEVSGVIDLEGTEVVGWDPANQRIRGWVFDSDGGFAQEHWHQENGSWLIKAAGVLPDGRTAASLRTIRRIDDEKYESHSLGRSVDGELLPDVGPFHVIRQGEQ
ncbi:YybH family protein [Blastopirellula retiformator]|uniref:SnoaL-like domain protein n=1 Tax=Blastopirellula retiformator TaxID=2527970 RepID=A0A5C5V1J0_9BACT|nr:SgcJ/EcaC family oxidoreductase [Blastopirellula retiformator]TWT31863.1 SnoaL-like domain protein [Blastopirellula retiformator]